MPRSSSALNAARSATLEHASHRTRSEIQALRALAVAAVVLYHLWPNRLTGGFVGVDVFFTISGFLIGSSLIAEASSHGRIRLGAFWARRARRLIPAACLVLVAVAIGVIAFVPRSRWAQFLTEVGASTLYVENWYLSWSSVDYLGAGNDASPVQHFWTLSVEEQFYIVLPIVLILVLGLAARLRLPFRRLAGSILLVLFVASLVHGLVETHWSAASAYFSTLTRGWEFLAGVLLAFLPVLSGGLLRAALASTGGVAIVVSMVVYSSTTPFPGIAAALPVLGAVLVIYAGRTFVSSIGSLRPVAYLGRISYAVYLWHWPLIVLVPYATGRPLTTADKVLIIAATLLAASASTHWVEEPLRFSRRLLAGRRPRSIAALSAGAMAVVIGIAGSGVVVAGQLADIETGTVRSVLADSPDCLGAAALADPGCENPELDGVLIPDPSNLAADDANLPACWSRGGDATLRMCTFGPEDATTRLLAIGDSHNNALIAAYEDIAARTGWRIDLAGRAGCYWSAAILPAPTTALTAECTEWRSQADALVESADVDAVVVTKARAAIDPGPADNAGLSEAEIVGGLVEAWALRDPGIPLVAIVDNPALPKDSVACVEEHRLSAADVCAIAAERALTFDGQDEAVGLAENAHLVDLTALYCTDLCSPIIGNVVAYRDDGRHLTATFAKTLAPYLERELRDAIGR